MMEMSMQHWLLGLLQAGVGVSAAAGLLALLQRALRRRIAARWFCAVWLVLAVRLVVIAPLPALVRLPLPAPVQGLLVQSGLADGAAGVTGGAARGDEKGVAPDGGVLGGGADGAGVLGAGPDAAADPNGLPGAGLPGADGSAGAGPGGVSGGASGAENAPGGGVPDGVPGAGSGAAAPAGPGAVRLLFAVWALGCGGVLLWRVWGHLRGRRALLRWAAPASAAQRALLAREAARMGLTRRIQTLRLVQSAEGPLLLGLWRPVLALPPLGGAEAADEPGDAALAARDGLAPAGLAAAAGAEQNNAALGAENTPALSAADAAARDDLALVLRHELGHLARRDLAVKALLTLGCALHWANPVVWWMARRASAEMELACDDLATQDASPAARRCYGEAILAAASARGGWRAAGLCTGFWGGKSGLRRRFEHLADGPVQPRRRASILFCLLAALLLAASWLAGALGAATAGPQTPGDLPGAGGEPLSAASGAASGQDAAPGTSDEPGGSFLTAGWQQQVVDFAGNAGAFAAPVFGADGETILAMRCEAPSDPAHWEPEEAAVKLSLLLPDGWAVHPAAAGEEVFASGNGLAAPFNLTDADGAWVGTMQYGSFAAGQLEPDEFYGGGSHGAYYWLWANPGGFGWDESSYRPAAGDAALDDPTAAGAALCETTGTAQAGHEGVLAHDGQLGRFVVIELRAGALSEAERLALAGSIRLLAADEATGDAAALAPLPDEPALPDGYAWQTAQLTAQEAPTDSSMPPLVRLRLALPAGCTLAEEADEAPDEAEMLGPRGVRILRDGKTVGRIECGGFASAELSGWPPENPREIYAFLMMSAHAGWDLDYAEIARSETLSVATCLVGREAAPRGPGPEAPAPGQEPENYQDGWWYQKGILFADRSRGQFAAIELEDAAFSDTVRREIALSVRFLEG